LSLVEIAYHPLKRKNLNPESNRFSKSYEQGSHRDLENSPDDFLQRIAKEQLKRNMSSELHQKHRDVNRNRTQEVLRAPTSKESVEYLAARVWEMNKQITPGDIKHFCQYMYEPYPQLALSQDQYKPYLLAIAKFSQTCQDTMDIYKQGNAYKIWHIGPLHVPIKNRDYHKPIHSLFQKKLDTNLNDYINGFYHFHKKNTKYKKSSSRISFHKKNTKYKKSSSRISLRLNPQYAIDVAQYVIADLIAKEPDVHHAKITGPDSINTRTDSLIIYINNRDENVAQHIANKLTSNFPSDYFLPGIPTAMKELAKGIGYAHGDGQSHSRLIANMLYEALNSYRSTGGTDWRTFIEKTLPNTMRKYGFNPGEPYKRL
jgi:hypothetical protein